jgi:hypothetical protein
MATVGTLPFAAFALAYQERYTPEEVGSLFGCNPDTMRRIARQGLMPFSRSSLTGNYWISYDRLVSYLRGRKADDPMRLLVRHVEPAPLPLRP